MDYRLMGQGQDLVVIETGLGNTYYEWLDLAERLSLDYRVLLYHRRGYGNSPFSHDERTCQEVARDLNQLTKTLDLDRFYLLGHSYGGLCALTYASLYPNQVKGVLLLDATSPHMMDLETLETPTIIGQCGHEKMIDYMVRFSQMTSSQLREAMASSLAKYRVGLLAEDFEAYQAGVLRPSSYETVKKELLAWPKSGHFLRDQKKSKTFPLLVIARDSLTSRGNWQSHGIPEKEAQLYEQAWRDLQEDLLSYSDQASLIVAKGCDHMIHLENAQYVLDGLKGLTRKVSNG